MININLFGGPGCGKSVTASGVFHEMKKSNYEIEYLPEFAKDLVYSKDVYKLQDQLMILANQSHPWFKLESQIDYTVNDGPFLLGLVYLQDNPHIPENEFKDFLLKMWNSYENINIFLERNLKNGYQESGRSQTLKQAIEKDDEIKEVLDRNGIPYHSVLVGNNSVKEIIKIVENYIEI